MSTDEESNKSKNANRGMQVCTTSTCNDNAAESFLIILDDKNKLISALEEQILNQKKQLDYYLKRGLSSNKIQELSQTCSPQATEEFIPVSLAVNKFCKNVGMKSRIMTLHERMCQIDQRIGGILQTQQSVLREIVSRLCEATKMQTGTPRDSKTQFGDFFFDKRQSELFSVLLNSTLTLGKALDTFRICCDRLILIEDERNEIVEQVYSLPVEQRLNCNYIISIQTEKIQLENEMKSILKDQEMLKQKIYELGMIEHNLEKLQKECKSNIEGLNCDVQISRMLKEVNSEAVMLLKISQEQKEKVSQEIFKLRAENMRLQKLLEETKSDEQIIGQNGNGASLHNVYYSHSRHIYDMIRRHFDMEKQQIIAEHEMAMQDVTSENNRLRVKLEGVEKEKQSLTSSLNKLKIDLCEMKSEYESEIEDIRGERDTYKSQVDDLLAIRSAYAQLIEKQTDVTEVEKNYRVQLDEKVNAIAELELQRDTLKKNYVYMEEVCLLQKSQIKYLMDVLHQFTEDRKASAISMHTSVDPIVQPLATFDEIDDTESNLNSGTCLKFHGKIQVDSSKSLNRTNDPSELSINASENDSAIPLHRKEPNTLLRHSDHHTTGISTVKSKVVQSVSEIKEIFACNNANVVKTTITETTQRSRSVTGSLVINSSKVTVHENRGNTHLPTLGDNKQEKDSDGTTSGLSTTSLQIHSTHRDGKTDVMKAVLETTTNVEGTFKLGDTSVSLKLDRYSVEPETLQIKAPSDLSIIDSSICQAITEDAASASSVLCFCKREKSRSLGEIMSSLEKASEDSFVDPNIRAHGDNVGYGGGHPAAVADARVESHTYSGRSLVVAKIRRIYDHWFQGDCNTR